MIKDIKFPDLKNIYSTVKHIAKSEYNIDDDFAVEFATFIQTFFGTAGLFRKNKDDFAGQSITDYPITVVHDLEHDYYYVFQEETPVYAVEKPTDDDITANGDFKQFLQDTNNHRLVPIYKLGIYSSASKKNIVILNIQKSNMSI